MALQGKVEMENKVKEGERKKVFCFDFLVFVPVMLSNLFGGRAGVKAETK